MRKRSYRLCYERRKSLSGFLYTLPWLIGTVYFFLIPLASSLLYSFNKLTIEPNKLLMSFQGMRYYEQALSKDYIRMLVESIGGLLYQAPTILIFSLFIAVILNQKFIGRTLFRGVFFLPLIIATGVVLGIMNGDVVASAMMNGQTNSALFDTVSVKTLLLDVGMPYELVDALYTIINGIFELTWKSGIQILLFLAGLQTIPSSVYEACKIEGSTGWETFWKITFPMISPVIMLNLIYTIIDNFTDSASNQVMITINRLSQQHNLELSAAMSWIYFVIVFLLILVVYALVNRKVYYAND